MISSHKQLTSGNFLIIRTESGKEISCETSKPASDKDKKEAEDLIYSIVEKAKFKGKPQVEWTVKKEEGKK